MRTLLTAAILVALMATPVIADTVLLEEGVTFYDDGTCIEADGTPGLSSADGSCVTAADYDEMFSYENLSTIPSQNDSTKSVAEVYDINLEVPASLRLLGIGLVDEPFTFRVLANGLVIL